MTHSETHQHPRSVAGSAQRRTRRESSARRVYDLLRAGIRRGDIASDASLVEDKLVDVLTASRQAVREALQTLAAEGLVIRRRRVGTTVSGSILDVAADQLMHLPPDRQDLANSTIEQIEAMDLPAPPWIRRRLRIPDTEQVRMVEELIRFRDEPICVRVSYVPLSRLPIDSNGKVADLASAFQQGYGVAMGPVESLVEAVGADAMTAELLGVPHGAPLLVREVLLTGADGLPRDLSFTHYRGDRVCFSGGPVLPAFPKA
jgi:GntR family transcriptional regulator